MILAESLLSAMVEHDTRQMQQVASVAGETVGGPLASSIRTRLPWLTPALAHRQLGHDVPRRGDRYAI